MLIIAVNIAGSIHKWLSCSLAPVISNHYSPTLVYILLLFSFRVLFYENISVEENGTSDARNVAPAFLAGVFSQSRNMVWSERTCVVFVVATCMVLQLVLWNRKLKNPH